VQFAVRNLIEELAEKGELLKQTAVHASGFIKILSAVCLVLLKTLAIGALPGLFLKNYSYIVLLNPGIWILSER
jgi:hypothetical protein